jgi:mannose-6-phosphate isomerase
MFLLENSIQDYAWGSQSAIAEMQGRERTGLPEAELWIGAHANAPSRIALSGQSEPLDRLIARDPEHWLGARVAQRFGGQFPFLLKLLAAATPLSLQAHPNIQQAIDGHAREDQAGIPVNAPHRKYRDRNHKPELICALVPFDALCGFRPVAESRQLFQRLDVEHVASWTRPLYEIEPPEQSLQQTFRALMSASKDAKILASRGVVTAAVRLLDRGNADEFEESLRWAVHLNELYPDDIGVVLSLLLNHVRLRPGEALYLPAGMLHAYLEGFGIEIMANSDNVLRGGCTTKHIDVQELERVLDFSSSPAEVLRGAVSEPGVRIYRTPAPEFELSALDVRHRLVLGSERSGPQLLLVTNGRVRVEREGEALELSRGQSALLKPDETRYALVADVPSGATVYRATVGVFA